MRLDEVRTTIQRSSPDDWHVISGDGPTYREWWSLVTGGDGQSLEMSSHHSVATWRNEVSLTMAWGLPAGEDLQFDWAKWPDERVSSVYLDVFWAGALIDRSYLLVVDGGRAYLPCPEAGGTSVAAPDHDVARLIDQMRTGSSEFDRYVREAGFTVFG